MSLRFAIKKVIVIIKNNFDTIGNFNIRQFEKTDKYAILSVAKLEIDSYDRCQIITPKQVLLEYNTKRCYVLFSLGNKTINSYIFIDHSNNNIINNNILSIFIKL